MKILLLLLVVIFVSLQYRLWVGEGSLAHANRLQSQIDLQKKENDGLEKKNHLLAAEVNSLKRGGDAIEERARSEMGMIKKGETYIMIVDENDDD